MSEMMKSVIQSCVRTFDDVLHPWEKEGMISIIEFLPTTPQPSGLLDATDGSLAAEFDYDPYGNPIIESITQSGNQAITQFSTCPFRHRTRYYDSESWLYYYGYRYYDPSTTKWISKDPLAEAGGWNLTSFCSNDPVNGFDPLGLAGYFFGGTGNSLEEEGTSNVEIMYRSWNEKINGSRYYVPGVFSGYNPDGTKEKSVWTPSKGWLISPLGTILKNSVSKGLEGARGKTLGSRVDEMMKKLSAELSSGDKIVNVFGFSRGATSALEFLNRIQDEINNENPLYDGITINFVALWDAVKTTSTDYRTELPKDMQFEFQPLHFIAIDEQRDAFYDNEVLNVQGAVQIGLRGVHADVGNAYKNNSFGLIALWITRAAAEHTGLKFDEKTIDSYQGTFDWRSKPTNNSRIFYGKTLRFFPYDMYIHSSVRQFGKYSEPLNYIDSYSEMTDDIMVQWKFKIKL
jgi:RHS repeat-associated protein